MIPKVLPAVGPSLFSTGLFELAGSGPLHFSSSTDFMGARDRRRTTGFKIHLDLPSLTVHCFLTLDLMKFQFPITNPRARVQALLSS